MGAISYVEYARRLLPSPGESDSEINHLTASMIPGRKPCSSEPPAYLEANVPLVLVVYWLVFFSIVIHGLSIPVLNGIYKWLRVPVIRDHPVELMLLSENEPVPTNSVVDRPGHLVVVNNRFSCISDHFEHQATSQQQDEPDTIILRSSGRESYVESLERSCSKGSSSQIEQIVTREVI